MNYKHFVKKTLLTIVLIAPAASLTSTAHAQSVTNSITTTLKNVVSASKQNGINDGTLRNQLILDNSIDTLNKERATVEQLNLNLLSLENIQTRIIEKTAEIEASGTDITSINAWLASSSNDILLSQNNIFFLSSEIKKESSAPINQVSLIKARTLANTAIDSMNTTHDDLQSALNAVTKILQ